MAPRQGEIALGLPGRSSMAGHGRKGRIPDVVTKKKPSDYGLSPCGSRSFRSLIDGPAISRPAPPDDAASSVPDQKKGTLPQCGKFCFPR